MKKISIIILLMFGTFSISIAQTTQPKVKTTVSKQDKAAIAAQKKAAKEQAKEAKAAAKAEKKAEEEKMKVDKTSTSTHLNKYGTPDKRFKANKEPKTTTTAQTQAPAPTPVQTQAATKRAGSVAHTRTPKTADKEIGKDSKGRTLYQGPRGGKYYLTANGNKEYEK